MGELAQLITAIAALVTSIGGAAAAIIVAVRSGQKQKKALREERVKSDTLPEDEADGGITTAQAQELFDLLGKLQPPTNNGS